MVAGLEANELVEVQRVAPLGGKTLVEGVGLQSRRMVKRPLAEEELAALVKVRGQQHTFDDPDVCPPATTFDHRSGPVQRLARPDVTGATTS